MRITILSGSVPSTTFIDALINTVAEAGNDVTVIGKNAGRYRYHAGVTVVIVPDNIIGRLLFIIQLLMSPTIKHMGSIWKQSKNFIGFYNDLLFYLPIIQSKPDKIHFQWAAFIHNRDLLFDLYPCKIVLSMRGAHINYTPITTPEIKESYKRLFPKVHRFHAVSDAIAREAVQYGSDINKTDVIYSFVKQEYLNKEITHKPVREKLHVISVGRFFWKKGYEYALDAMYRLKKEGVPFTYTLIAEGDTPASIIYQLHQMDLTNDVKIINGMPHDDVVKAIEHHDILLLPSVEEGIANVVMEAMAMGTPVVTTDVGGMREVVDDGRAGYLVKARDAQAMAEALTSFSKLDVNERYEMAVRGRKQLDNKHDKKTFVALFRQFYNN